MGAVDVSAIRHRSGPTIDQIVETVRRRHGPQAAQRAVGAVARELRAVIEQSFNTQATPEGVPWRPLKQPRPGRRILQRTGTLRRRAANVLLFGNTVRVQMPPYGALHISGTSRMPARPFVPGSPLDPALRVRFQQAIARAVLDA